MKRFCSCEVRQPDGSVSEKCYYCGKPLPPKPAAPALGPGYDANGSYVSMPTSCDDDD